MAMLYFKIKTQMLCSPLQPFSLYLSLSIHSHMVNWTEWFSVQLIMMCWDDVWTWQGIVGNNRIDLFTGSM